MLNKGIKAKLISTLVVTVLVVMSIFSLVLDRYLKSYSITEAEKTILFLGQNASTLLQKPLFDADYQQLANIARPLILADFDYLVIFDNITRNIAFKEEKTGRAVGDTLRLAELVKDKNAFEKTRLELNGADYTQYLFPITSLGVNRPLGFLVIGISADRMKSKLGGITRRIMLISILLFVTLTLTIYFLSDRIVKPLKLLAEKIESFAHGDYSVRSHIKTRDEIRTLSDNFNIMADKINEQILSIENYSKKLEKNVEERTDDLLKAMDAIKEKDKKINQAEKISSLNSIVSSIAHEINNPLAIISGNLQLLEVKVENPLVKKKLDAAEEAIQRIANLIDEINFFSAIKNIYIASLSFSNLLSAAISKVVPADIPITIDGGKDDRIHSNANLLSISLENILKNSVEVIQTRNIKGKIQVRYSREHLLFTVEIIDNGGGVQEPEKVFHPFYTTFSQKKGLGLTFVYHAIQALSGEVTVENVDQGAKVTLILPVEEEQQDKES